MRRYAVTIQGSGWSRTCELEARSPGQAVLETRRAFPQAASAVMYSVYRHRRFGPPKLVASFPGPASTVGRIPDPP